MATTIKIKRGLKTNLPTLAVGELGYCTDTNELFIGTSTGNELINEDSSINALGDIGDVNVSNLQNGDVLVYDGTKWVNSFKEDFVFPVTLGVEWDQDTDTLVRLDDAVGLTAGSDFDEFNPYKLRRCMVNDDLSINYYIDPDNPNLIGEVVNTGSYTTGGTANYTGSHGQVMVEIPKFWWKTDEPTSDQYQWRISDEAQTGFTVHPAFITDGVTKDYIYMSAFEGNLSSNVLRSISGVQPTAAYNINASYSIDWVRSFAQARGTGWQIQTYWGTHALQLLYLIEYADFDTQTTIGSGVVNASGSGNESINTGATISLGNASGAASGTDGLSSISYRGVENFWGNILKFTDGININDNVAYVANENFASDVYTGDYTSVGSITFASNYVSDIQFPHFLATEVNGSSSSHLHDYQFRNTGQRIGAFGGTWFNDTAAGGFSWNLNLDSSYESRIVGSRLQIL